MKASIILLIVFCGLTKALIREHFYVKSPNNWTDAQSYCRKFYKDLSTITSQEEQDVLIQLTTELSLKWIGLNRNKSNINQILWSDGHPFSFSKWDQVNPVIGMEIKTVYYLVSCGQTTGAICYLIFFCYKAVFILVKEKKTWEEVQQYCRTHHTDLASITTKRQLQLIKIETRESQTESVWTGLRYLVGQWFWVNMTLGIQTSLPECPTQPYRCGARNTKTDKWENRDCDKKGIFPDAVFER